MGRRVRVRNILAGKVSPRRARGTTLRSHGSPRATGWRGRRGPGGAPLARRAIQLGLRGETLSHYARDWIVAIEDISAFVAEKRFLLVEGRLDELLTPHEAVYPVGDAELAARLGVDLVDR